MISITNALSNFLTTRRTEQEPAERTATPAVLRPEDDFTATPVQARGGPTPQEREIAGKINDLVQRRFGGDWQKAFRHYAGADGQVDRNEVLRMLGDAGLGWWPPHGAVADELIKKFDTDRNGKINWDEFSTGMRNLGFRV